MSTSMTGPRWKDYWAEQTTAQHTRSNEEFYRAHAAELRQLYAGHPVERVLEIGCGDGALFPHLGFDMPARYLGVDFSPAMLAGFRARNPAAEVVLADGPDFRSTERFDLVFSNQVVQYWDRGQLARHLDHATSMLADDGLLVMAGIPWSRMRLAYARGDLTGGRRRSLPVAALAAAYELVIPRIGRWYDFPEVERLALSRNLRVEFRGSGHYPYRFHAVLRRRG